MKYLILTLVLISLVNPVRLMAQKVHHFLDVSLDVSENAVFVEDSVVFEDGFSPEGFLLNPYLILEDTSGLRKSVVGNVHYYSLPDSKDTHTRSMVIRYRSADTYLDTIAGRYFSEIINRSGVFLSGSAFWIPDFGSGLITFELSVQLSNDWTVVSQGIMVEDTVIDNRHRVVYHSVEPMEQCYLIAARFTTYKKYHNNILIQAFLREPDSLLANQYLDATSMYLNAYESMIAEYPYSKFALVENYQETGLGMPSFTLLGTKIIKYPWIIQTSYPHELLHNWWGNGVYVDYEKGNWCEGITTYMSDHLQREQTGRSSQYRKNHLIDFASYVNESNDYPLIDFRSKISRADESIGYGKGMFFNHMLRLRLGDSLFLAGYRDFYLENRFKKATYKEIQNAFEKTTKTDLSRFFSQWVFQSSAPELKIKKAKVIEKKSEYFVNIDVIQAQNGDAYELDIPVALYFKNDTNAFITNIRMTQKEETWSIPLKEKPVELIVDPAYDVFRKLDDSEKPSTLSKIYGETNAIIILPSKSPLINYYIKVAQQLKDYNSQSGKTLTIVYDSDLKKLPSDKAIWLYGFENIFYNQVDLKSTYPGAFDSSELQMIDLMYSKGSLLYVCKNPSNVNSTVGVFATNRPHAIPGIIRKMPFYGSQTYLGFAGDEPQNVLKGLIESETNSLRVIFDNKLTPVYRSVPEKPLYSLP